MINLQTPAPFDEFYIPPRGDENPEAGLGSKLELTKEGDVRSGPPVAYFDLPDYDLGDLTDGMNGTDFIDQSQDDYIPVVRPNHNGGQYSEGDFFAKRIDLPQYLIIISMLLTIFKATSCGTSGDNPHLSLHCNWYHALAIFLGRLDLSKVLSCPKDEVCSNFKYSFLSLTILSIF